MSDLGKFITEHRTAKKLSRRKLAELANISHTEIHRLENGERKNPSPPLLKSIATALGVPYDDIMLAAGYIEDSTPTKSIAPAHANVFEELKEEEIEEVKKYIEFIKSKRK